jgi:hypothetical protein
MAGTTLRGRYAGSRRGGIDGGDDSSARTSVMEVLPTRRRRRRRGGRRGLAGGAGLAVAIIVLIDDGWTSFRVPPNPNSPVPFESLESNLIFRAQNPFETSCMIFLLCTGFLRSFRARNLR